MDLVINLAVLFNIFLKLTWCDSLRGGGSLALKLRHFISTFISSGIFRSWVFYDEILLSSDEYIFLSGRIKWSLI